MLKCTIIQVYLQKHSALEAEVNANEASLQKLKTDGANIIDNNLPQTADVQVFIVLFLYNCTVFNKLKSNPKVLNLIKKS